MHTDPLKPSHHTPQQQRRSPSTTSRIDTGFKEKAARTDIARGRQDTMNNGQIDERPPQNRDNDVTPNKRSRGTRKNRLDIRIIDHTNQKKSRLLVSFWYKTQNTMQITHRPGNTTIDVIMIGTQESTNDDERVAITPLQTSGPSRSHNRSQITF